MGAGAGCASVAGFIQMCLGVALLVVASTDLRHAGPGSCVYGAADMDQGPGLCDTLTVLAWLSVGSSLIIAVGQGALGLFLRMPPRGVELLGRMALTVAWLVAAILTTVATVQADHADPNRQRAHSRHVGLGVAWGMALVASIMSLAALVGCLCVDLPLAVLCCCLPCCMGGGRYQQGGCDVCELTGLACCLYWCLPSSWLPPRREHDLECQRSFGSYQRLPSPGPGPYQTHAPPQHPPPIPYTHPGAGPSSAYPPPTVIHTDRPGQPYETLPVGRAYMAPVYSPFSAGPVPQTVGWGVPVAPAVRPGPWTGQQAPSSQAINPYPQVQPGTGAWYPSEGQGPPAAGYEGGGGGGGPSAPPYKATAPSATPHAGQQRTPLPEPVKGEPSAPPYPKLG